MHYPKLFINQTTEMKTFQLAATPRLLLLLCSLLLCLDSFAQSLKITGTVSGADGQKIPGASISSPAPAAPALYRMRTDDLT